MSQCDRDCASCGKNCDERKTESLLEKPNELSHIGKVVGVLSGKGGVGKSMVTSLLAVMARRRGLRVGVLDADITGPSIPKGFGIRKKAEGSELGIFPVTTKTGIEIMSLNLLVENETDPVVWRGPIISGAVKQFWTDVIWGDLDVLFIDMPPGTGDVTLTVFQQIPVDGAVLVSTPQELVGMIVKKALAMARMMDIPVIGLVENMSYAVCPDCEKRIELFGPSRGAQLAASEGISSFSALPVDPALTAACDHGEIEGFDGKWLEELLDVIESLEQKER